MDQQNSTEKTLVSKIAAVLGGLVGLAVGQYSGINFLIPLAGTLLAWWAASKLITDEKKNIIPAFAVNAGHLLWLSLALALAGLSFIKAVGGDIIFYIVGLVWLVKKPSNGAIYFLCTFQVVSIAINCFVFSESAIGTQNNKALLVHLIWRCVAVYYLVQLFISIRYNKNAQQQLTVP